MISILVAVPLAIASALRRNRATDHAIRLFSMVTFAMPSFLLGLLLILFFSLKLGWLPTAGYGEDFLGHLRGLTLPAITVGLYLAPILLRTLRVGIIETLGTEFVEAARARGLSERRIVLKHVLRNSLVSTVTVLGLNIGFLLSGLVIIENVFALPGPRRRAGRTRSWPGLSDDPGADARLRRRRGRDQPAHRPRLRQARSAGAAVSVRSAGGRPAAEARRCRSARPSPRGCSGGRAASAAGRRSRSGSGSAIVAVIAFVSFAAPLLGFENPNEQHLLDALQPPSLDHPIGTDTLGRDILTRVVYGGRIDLTFAVVTTIVPFVLGALVGALAGYRGGWLDTVVNRLVDTVVAFPFIVLILAIVAITGPGLTGAYIGVFAVGWALYARLTRGEMLVEREKEYILAAQTLGYSTPTDRLPPRAAQRAAREHRLLDGGHRAQHPAALGALLSRPRRQPRRRPSGARWSPRART